MLSKNMRTMAAKAKMTSVAQRNMSSSNKAPVRVAVTGGAGQIAYSLLFRIAR